jgi:hypothetical protein
VGQLHEQAEQTKDAAKITGANYFEQGKKVAGDAVDTAQV